MRTLLVFLAGLTFGIALTFGAVMVSGGWYHYRILTGPLSAFREAVERDGCEPIEMQNFVLGRCPRFHWP